MYPGDPTWSVPTKSLPKKSKRSTYGKQRKELGIEPLHSVSEEPQSKPVKKAWEPPFSSQSEQQQQPSVESDPFGRSGKQGPLRKIEPYPLPGSQESKEIKSEG